jgi:L-threonylcarbamoyladenylate synthase
MTHSTQDARIKSASAAALQEAAQILRRGGLVAFPTETVYGLGADAESEVACRALYAAKGRPADHPVIVHLASVEQLDDFAVQVPAAAKKLAVAFWPGPLTLVLRASSRVNRLVTGGLATVGLRVPAHPVALALLRAFGGPVAAPSANRFGRVSPTLAAHVASDFAEEVEMILDGGPCAVGLESTILDLSGERIAILRPGAITAEQIADVLGEMPAGAANGAPRVSGSLPSHYAPRARIEIVSPANLEMRGAQLAASGKRVAVLSRKSLATEQPGVIYLEIPAEAADFAQSLYALLREVDRLRCDVALVTLPAENGLGIAIADRLRRAAGPREVES